MLFVHSQQYIFSGATLKTVYNTASNLKMFGEKFAWFALTKVKRLKGLSHEIDFDNIAKN